ncbi:MAG: prepilin-type N-terminal cleavage/methylation domain-containing protein [Vicinamibacterales bacterium]
MTGTSAAGVKAIRNQDGFTLIDMLFVVALIGLLSTLAIPGLMRARNAAQSASALGTIRLVNSAQLSYAITCGLGFYSPDFPTLTVKPPHATEAFLAADLATGPTFLKSGYNFSMAGTPQPGAPASCNGLAAGAAAPAYALIADQLDATPTKGRFFGTNADGAIYEDTSSLAATMPEAGAPPQGEPIK